MNKVVTMTTEPHESNTLAKSWSLYIVTTQREEGANRGIDREEMYCFCVGVVAVISDDILHCVCSQTTVSLEPVCHID